MKCKMCGEQITPTEEFIYTKGGPRHKECKGIVLLD